MHQLLRRHSEYPILCRYRRQPIQWHCKAEQIKAIAMWPTVLVQRLVRSAIEYSEISGIFRNTLIWSEYSDGNAKHNYLIHWYIIWAVIHCIVMFMLVSSCPINQMLDTNQPTNQPTDQPTCKQVSMHQLHHLASLLILTFNHHCYHPHHDQNLPMICRCASFRVSSWWSPPSSPSLNNQH